MKGDNKYAFYVGTIQPFPIPEKEQGERGREVEKYKEGLNVF